MRSIAVKLGSSDSVAQRRETDKKIVNDSRQLVKQIDELFLLTVYLRLS